MPDFETVNEIRERQDAEAAKKLKADQKRMGVHPTLSNKPDAVAARAAKQEAPDKDAKKQRSEPGSRAYSASADSNVNHGPEQQTSPSGNQMNVTGAGTTDASSKGKQDTSSGKDK